jgi:8-oxo-dGTP pyrophosphatase MutT (NUDIX family)
MSNVIDFLDAYDPRFEEKSFKSEMTAFYKKYENCFERSCVEGHFTASAWVVNGNNSAFLLMHHKKLDKWLQLGGHCDGNEDVLSVAIKEVQEESGMKNIKPLSDGIFDIDVHFIPAYKNIPPHKHLDVRFLLQADIGEILIKNHESIELRWFSRNDVLPTTEHSIMRMYEKWLSLN